MAQSGFILKDFRASEILIILEILEFWNSVNQSGHYELTGPTYTQFASIVLAWVSQTMKSLVEFILMKNSKLAKVMTNGPFDIDVSVSRTKLANSGEPGWQHRLSANVSKRCVIQFQITELQQLAGIISLDWLWCGCHFQLERQPRLKQRRLNFKCQSLAL